MINNRFAVNVRVRVGDKDRFGVSLRLMISIKYLELDSVSDGVEMQIGVCSSISVIDRIGVRIILVLHVVL